MPANKNAFNRYLILDELLADRMHSYDINDLTRLVNNKLVEDGFNEVTRRCHHIMEKPINDDWKILQGHEECDRCRKTNLIKWDNNCPKCGGFMRLEPTGMWD